ncbi:MAG: 5-formyltetrahydrofolate cyclo-ligase [Firmicutes bacterium]|nr:5-formyltetrahydrofolate cyclo-ligase [Bacillota bacterium]
MEIAQQKKELRAIYQRKLEQLPFSEVKRRSELICTYALALPALRRTTTVAAYASINHEVMTDQLLAGLLAEDFRLALPVVKKKNRTMEFRLVENLKDLTPGPFGILEPQKGPLCPPDEIGVFFIPGLAFDRQGNRLGRGAGYYDRYLATVNQPAVRVGLAFQLQIAEALPVTATDVKIDSLLTEEGLIF